MNSRLTQELRLQFLFLWVAILVPLGSPAICPKYDGVTIDSDFALRITQTMMHIFCVIKSNR
jgi:hypothetical protein